VGGGNWIATNASGLAVLGEPGTASLGSVRSGALEDSNVDLTAELVAMMTAQRAYQANVQTIKTQDQALSSLTTLR
jgi:flagellar hook protein FlgE